MSDESERMKRNKRDAATDAALIKFYGSPEELAKQRAETQQRMDEMRKMQERGYDFTSPGQSERHRDEDDPKLDRERARKFKEDSERALEDAKVS